MPRLHDRVPWLRSLSARMVLLNTAVTIGLSALMILILCLLAERFMQAHLDDTVLDELHVMESEFGIDGLRGVASLIGGRIAANPDGRQAYLLLDPFGRKIAGNLAALPPPGGRTKDGYTMPTLHQPVDATLRLLTSELIDGSRLVVGFDDHEITVFVEALQRSATIGFAITVLLGIAAGALSSRLTLNQIEAINRTANRIIAGDLHQRVPLRGSRDEFDRLGNTLNEMLDRINELMNAVRYATESIAHDLRSPLTRMRNRIESARAEQGLSPDGQKELLDQLSGEVDRVLIVFSSLLRLATIESGVLRSGFQRVDLRPLVDDAVSLYEALASERDISISTVVSANGADGVDIDGDRDLLFQTVCNLLDNAVKFSPDGAEVRVELAVEQGQARIRIRDRGPGIPAEQRERVFERLVRLDSSRGSPGFGLGLSLVRGIARLHRGDCRLLDGSPGTLAVLELPLAE